MLLDRLDIDPAELTERTGWTVEPRGACKGAVCVPLPPEVHRADGRLDVDVLARGLGMPVVHDDELELWAVGPASVTGRALDTASAPPLTLPDLDGNPFDLAALAGRKVLLVAWASW